MEDRGITVGARLRRAVLVSAGGLGALGVLALLPAAFGPGAVLRATLPPARAAADGPAGDVRPLVVIDAGHGGRDPGAKGAGGIEEKDLVLALAKALAAELQRRGVARVALTRDDDTYLAHAARFETARRMDADLFLSIHADSAGEAGEVSGASIYTLSEEPSSRAAARFAARENASDRLNGMDMGGQSEEVNAILFDLSQQRTRALSGEFARGIQTAGEGRLAFHPSPLRSAALKVLRAPDVPSVLFESGFITNPAEARALASPAGRARFAATLADAIEAFFARNPRG